MTVEALTKPVAVGKELTYEVRILNQAQTMDRLVSLSVNLPAAMVPVPLGTTGPPLARPAINKQTVRFDPVPELRPGETLVYRIRARTKQPGPARVTAEVSSFNQPQPMVTEETTEVVSVVESGEWRAFGLSMLPRSPAPDSCPALAILQHDSPRGLHWDLLLEVGQALKTWALPQPPQYSSEMICEALPDHRPAYLEYEGPVSGGRGTVTRWDDGEYQTECQNEGEWIVRLAGRRLVAKAVLTCSSQEPGKWSLRLGGKPEL